MKGKVEGRRKMRIVVAVMLAAVMLPEAAALRYIVGSNRGWTTNINYSVWAQDKHFYNGDWLFFMYDRDQMNVLEVNNDDYDNCSSDHPLHNWTTGAGRDDVHLNVTKTYYFISGKGFCFEGVKLAIHVDNPPPPPRAASPIKSREGAPTSTVVSAPPAAAPVSTPPASAPVLQTGAGKVMSIGGLAAGGALVVGLLC